MRPVNLGHSAVVALAVLLTGCAPGPAETTMPSVSPTSMAPTDAPTPAPPLAGELTGGTPLSLGSRGHWAIADGAAFMTTDQGSVAAVDLVTGATRWRADFTQGKPWDSQPTLGLSADRRTVIAIRTVDAGGAPTLDLVLLDAVSGVALAEYLLADPSDQWQIDLPPRILAADDTAIVLADNPESGRQTAVIDLTGGTLRWWVDDEAVAVVGDLVVTRGAGWSRSDGSRRWQSAVPLGQLLAAGTDALVVQSDSHGLWLDPGTGAELARTGTLGELEPPCVATTDTLVCVGASVVGYSLASGERLWSSPDSADFATTLAEWVYLWRTDGRGDVLDVRTGQVLVTDAELPPIRYTDDTGILLAAENGYTWVPYVR